MAGVECGEVVAEGFGHRRHGPRVVPKMRIRRAVGQTEQVWTSITLRAGLGDADSILFMKLS